MFKITTGPDSYRVYWKYVGTEKLQPNAAYIPARGCCFQTKPLSPKNAELVLNELQRQWAARRVKLPFDEFEAVVGPAEPQQYLYVTEQGQALLENNAQVAFTDVPHCSLSINKTWLLPLTGRNQRNYCLPEDWERLEEFKQFLAGLYPEQEQWILPE